MTQESKDELNNNVMQIEGVAHLFKHKVTGQFYYADEAENLVGPYDDINAAGEALAAYIKHELRIDIEQLKSNVEHLMAETGITQEQLNQLSGSEGESAEEIMHMFAMMTAPKVTVEERDQQIEAAVPLLISEMDKGRQAHLDKFPTNEEAVRFWTAGYLYAKYKEDMPQLLMEKKVGVPTMDDAIEIIKTELLSHFYRPVPEMDPPVFAFVGRKGNLNDDVIYAIASHWERYGAWMNLQNGTEEKPVGYEEMHQRAVTLGGVVITKFMQAVKGFGAEVVPKAMVLLMQHVQADYIADAAAAGPMELQAFLTMTGLGGAIENDDEAVNWLSTMIQQICIDVENPDMDEKDQILHWNALLEQELIECFEKETLNVVAELTPH